MGNCSAGRPPEIALAEGARHVRNQVESILAIARTRHSGIDVKVSCNVRCRWSAEFPVDVGDDFCLRWARTGADPRERERAFWLSECDPRGERRSGRDAS